MLRYLRKTLYAKIAAAAVSGVCVTARALFVYLIRICLAHLSSCEADKTDYYD